MGLPGSGKTTLAKKVSHLLKADWFNADKIRGKHNDWDFGREGIIRQIKRIKFCLIQQDLITKKIYDF